MTPPDTLTAAGPVARVRAVVETRPVVAVWFGTVMFSTGPVMVAAASVPGPVFSFWRLWIGTVLLAVLVAAGHRRGTVSVSRAGVRWTMLAGVAFGVHQLLFMTALRTTSVVDVTLMNTLAPVMVAVLAAPMFGERPGPAFRAWSAVAIVGAAIVALAGSTGPAGNPVGMALAAGNVAFYALFFVWSKRARDHIDTWSFLLGSVAVSAIVVTLFVLATGAPIGDISGHDLVLCVAVAALPGITGHFSVTWSLKWVAANLPPVIMLSIPVLSGLMAWIVVGQTVSAAKVAGGVVTLAGVAGAVRSPAARRLSAVEALDLAEET